MDNVNETPKRKSLLTRVDQLKLDPAVCSAEEKGYRRGYCQGYQAAIEDAQKYRSEEMLDHLYGKLSRWRSRQDKGYFPPVIKTK